jgi:predicted AlkP superfamily phosphohydrolase/phosphomutase
MKKMMVIGLDCATPQLVFDTWREELPHLNSLMSRGVYSKLESTIPPITVPAWACMVTGMNPGTLGFYGFRNRKDYSYDKLSFVTSHSLKEKTVWDHLSDADKDCIIMAVPPSYPPRELKGAMISCFLTPGSDSEYAYPPDLKKELEDRFGEYIFDVRKFRTDDKDFLIQQVYEMTEQRFGIAKYLATEKPWTFFMFVEMGLDRLHHGLWKFFDKEHPLYEPGNPYENKMLEYYRFVDTKLGELLSVLDEDTRVMVVSDHGSKRMDGGICINEWLVKEGYLTLNQEIQGLTKFEPSLVDWSNTKVWAAGGYYSRVFLNVKGREPNGIITQEEYENVRNELIEKLEALPDENGKPIGTRVYKPEDLYPEVRNIAPDLIVLFGDLYWRAVATLGFDTVWVHENDTGPDDANHSQHGIFIYYDPKNPGSGQELEPQHIMDIAPTILKELGHPVPEDMQGKSIF